MSSLLTLKMGMVVEQEGRDDKGEREGFLFFIFLKIILFLKLG